MTNDPKTPPSPGDAILDGESVIWEDPTPTEDRVARVRLELARARQIIDECERLVLQNALKENAWNKSRVTKALGIPRQSLYNKIARYGLKKPVPAAE